MMTVPVPMEAEPESSTGSSSKTPVGSSSSSSGYYQFYLGDSDGLLKSHRIVRAGDKWTGEGVPRTLMIKGFKGNGSGLAANETAAVQKMACGSLSGVGFVLAMARKNAIIDIITIPSSSTSTSPAKLLTTIDNTTKMKAGLQRWVGLAVAPHGIYACTSAGDWTFSKIHPNIESDDGVQVTTHRLALPEPLQSCSFHPEYDPKWFAYGGEEVPLSVWDLERVVSGRGQEEEEGEEEQEEEQQAGEPTAPNGDETNSNAPALNSKQRKRKRQVEARAKAKELLPGELWRAKNLPNDALSLPQRPNITSIAFLQDNTITTSLPFQIATGTRDGLIRIYDPSSGVRKHLEEFRVVPHTSAQGQATSPIKGLYPTHPASSSLIAADGSGRLACVDWTQAKSRYQWKDISGSITSVVSFPNDGAQLLLSGSHDRMVRLHSLTSANDVPNTKGQHGDRGKNLLSTFSGGAGVTAIVWDGNVPQVERAAGVDDGDADESMRSQRGPNDHGDEEEDGDEDEDGVWDAMQEVGNTKSSGKGPTGDHTSSSATARQTRRQRAIQEEEEAAEADEEAAKEERSKRKK